MVSEIRIEPTKCTGCLNCQLICSFTFTKEFNPAKARVLIELNDEKTICFTDECVGCGLCVDYCVYGAIRLEGD